MKTESKYRKGLKELLKEKSLDEINVVLLCKFVNSNRQTFYYHYRDISDVVENIFLKEKIDISKKATDFDSFNRLTINYINSNYNFLSKIAKSYTSNKLREFFFSNYYRKISQFLKKYKISSNDMFVINRYISNIVSTELFFYVSTKRKEKPASLLKRFSVIWDYFTKQYLLDLNAKKGVKRD